MGKAEWQLLYIALKLLPGATSGGGDAGPPISAATLRIPVVIFGMAVLPRNHHIICAYTFTNRWQLCRSAQFGERFRFRLLLGRRDR